MNETQQYLDQLNTDKSNLVTNLVNKGVSATNDETFTTLVPKVSQIEPILQAKSTYASATDDVVVTASPSYDGLSKVTVHQITSSSIPNLTPEVIKRNEVILDITGTYGPTSQVKNATPSTKSQVIKPDEGIEFMSAVNLSAVTSSIDSNIQPENIKNAISILGVQGTYTGDLVLEAEKTVTPVKAGSTVVPSSGYDAMEQVKINPVTASIDSNIQPQNIKKDITILGVEGTYEPEPTQEKTVTPKTTSQILQPDEGYSGLSKVTVQGVTSDIDADIKASNILDGVTILGVTGNVIPLTAAMMEEKTVTPSTSSQILTPSAGKEGFSKVTVYPVTSAIDTNITPENIKVNKTILGVTGTYAGEEITLQEKTVNPTPSQQEILPDAEYDGLSKVTVTAIETEELSVTPTMQQQVYDHSEDTPYSKVTVGAVTSSIDPNIQPENIKRNMSILGVIGTYEGEEQTYFGTLSAGSETTPGIVKAILSVPNDLVITGTNGDYLFKGCTGLTSIPQLDYSSLTSTQYTFANLTNLSESIDLTLASAATVNYLFDECIIPQNFSIKLPSLLRSDFLLGRLLLDPDNNYNISITLGATEPSTRYSITNFFSLDHLGGGPLTSGKPIESITFDSSSSLSFDLSQNTFFLGNTGKELSYIRKVTITDNIKFTNYLPCFRVESGNYHVTSNYEISINLDSCLNIGSGTFQYDEIGTWNTLCGPSKITFTGSAGNVSLIKTDSLSYGIPSTKTMTVSFPNGIPNLGLNFQIQEEHSADHTLDFSKFDVPYTDLITTINGLADLNNAYNVAGGGTLYRQYFILGSTNYAKLSPEEIAIATNKGWDVVESAS